MTYSQTRSKYIQTEITTAGKLEIVIMCYDKSIQLLGQAKEHLITGEYEAKYDKLSKVMGIIGELKGNLDFDHGGDVAKNLDAIYTYLTNRLVEGDLEKDTVAFDESIAILIELREAWVGLSDKEEGIREPENIKNASEELNQIAA